jgi:hypothetical protein
MMMLYINSSFGKTVYLHLFTSSQTLGPDEDENIIVTQHPSSRLDDHADLDVRPMFRLTSPNHPHR